MPLVEGLRNPTVARDDDIRRLLPIDRTSFEDAAMAALRGCTDDGAAFRRRRGAPLDGQGPQAASVRGQPDVAGNNGLAVSHKAAPAKYEPSRPADRLQAGAAPFRAIDKFGLI